MIRTLNKFLILVLLALGAWLFFEDELRPADAKILFIGNSFTFGSNVPGMVEALGRNATPSVIYHTRMIAKPNYRLSQHIAEGDAVREIRSGVWDVVVLQDQSAAPFFDDRRRGMQRSMRQLAEEASAAGSQVLLYAHWAPGFIESERRAAAIRRIEQTYAQTAIQTGAKVITVGQLWQRAFDAGVTGLYASDDHHASTLGAYAAAVAILHALGEADPVTATWMPPGTDPETAERIRGLTASLTSPRRLP